MADRERTCPVCGSQFTFGLGRGKARAYCKEDCSRAAKAARHHSIKARCTVEGCSRRCRSKAGLYCEAHYYRIRRNGSLALPALPDLIGHSHGYALANVPGHPLRADKAKGNREYEHRVVFYDAHGDGPFSCHWCSKKVGWSDMHVDHLNAVRDDNELRNLVPSCPPCNIKRGVDAMRKTMRTRWATHLTVRGETKSIAEWAEAVGIHKVSLKARLKAGWTAERAVSEPRGKSGPRRLT